MELVSIAFGLVVGWVGASVLEYAKAKGKNRADLEDQPRLTDLLEAIRLNNSLVLEQFKGKGQLRLAAAERRLQAHQEAFVLWRKVMFHAHKEDAQAVVLECQAWWERNCLYLTAEAREAFSGAYHAAGNHRTLLDAVRYQGLGPETLNLNWNLVKRAGDIIVDGVSLPPLAGPEVEDLPDAFGKSSATH